MFLASLFLFKIEIELTLPFLLSGPRRSPFHSQVGSLFFFDYYGYIYMYIHAQIYMYISLYMCVHIELTFDTYLYILSWMATLYCLTNKGLIPRKA